MLKQIWNKFIPFKMSFIVWRILKGKLSFDDIVVRFSKYMASRCNCCRNLQAGSMVNTFFEGELAKKIWIWFGGGSVNSLVEF